MSYPRYHNVQRVEGEGMGFDTYLKQIRLLYPNLPDLYVQYLRVIYQFNKEQLDRMLQLGHYDIAYEIVDAYTQVLEQFKDRDRDTFLQFVDGYGYTNRMIDLLEIQTDPDLIGYCETASCLYSPGKEIYFSQPYDTIVSLALSPMYIDYELLDNGQQYVGVQLKSDQIFTEDTPITLIAICGLATGGDALV